MMYGNQRWSWMPPFEYGYPPPQQNFNSFGEARKYHKHMLKARKEWEDEQSKKDKEKKEKEEKEKQVQNPLTKKTFSVMQMTLLLLALAPFVGPLVGTFYLKNLAVFRDLLIATLK